MMSQTERNARRRDAREAEKPETDRAPTCPYCGQFAVLMLDSSPLYANGTDWGPMWTCLNPAHDRAWVGCHKGTHRPLGRLADKALRQAKVRAHAALDPLWRHVMERDAIGQGEARKRAYAWLGKQMGLTPEQMHIGLLDVAQCARVVEICAPYLRKAGGNG